MKHQKHAKLTKPNLGQFHRNEWAIIGTPCGNIQQLAFQLTKRLSAKYKVSYVDADHKSAGEEAESGRDKSSATAYGASLEYTDKITFHRIDFEGNPNTYQFRNLFNEQDLVLVNGNHFKAKAQIVVIDPRKEKSLQKKLDRLTDVQLILLEGEVNSIPPFLKTHLMELGIGVTPVFRTTDVELIADFLMSKMEAALSPVSALVLAGGKSVRMGKDKGLINYHGKPQREYVFDLLNELCGEVYLSCRSEQVHEMPEGYSTLPDSFSGLGPFGAILSAFRQQPNHAWLVIACDLPLMNAETLEYLLANRNPSKTATAFNSPVNEFPEPLIAIWEPRSYLTLFQFLTQGFSCPRKVLINSDVQLLDAPEPKALTNVNSPEEYEKIIELLKATNLS